MITWVSDLEKKINYQKVDFLRRNQGPCELDQMSKKLNNSCSMEGGSTDPEALGLACHHHEPTLIIVYCQAATNLVNQDRGGGGVMICLSQGGLHSLSAPLVVAYIYLCVWVHHK